ncbi:MAG: (Fe-S)-binding protein [Caldilineales bacterium]|nr:(Fe-S)-binding protein [Caldilineales bacterium]
MLTTIEKLIFILLVAFFVGFLALRGFWGIYKIVRQGRPAPALKNIPQRMLAAVVQVGLQQTIFRSRPWLSVFHAFIFFGFSYYFLVNVTDLLEGFAPGFELVYGGRALAAAPTGLVNLFNLVADILSVLTLLGMIVFLVRRFISRDQRLRFNEGVLLNPRVQAGGVARDSLIVGGFILLHVGSRFLGQALRLAEHGAPDPFMPFASLTANLFGGLSPAALDAGIHTTWWLAIGLIVLFFPYFVVSKHIHLMVAPINLGLAKQNPRGQLDDASPPGSDIQPGAANLLDLAWPRLLDAYACIMCNRCNDVCPAHSLGSVLSPAAVEVNKRYLINQNFAALAGGSAPPLSLIEHVISPQAVWSCTTCYACVRVCPVGNEPMADIVDIRRSLLIQGDGLDSGVQTALESLSKNGNWFGQGKRARPKWSKALDIEIKDAGKEAVDYLWFVGDTASFDSRVTPLTQAFARILHHAGVDFGILGQAESNAGNDVRRMGEEGLFEQLMENNLKAFSASTFERIVTTDPHSLNTLRNEYRWNGNRRQVIHYSSLLLQLFESGRLQVTQPLSAYVATYHDPCYLGRYNGEYQAVRKLLQHLGVALHEMPRNCENSFCCGGGGHIWMGETPPGERPAENRIREAVTTLTAHAGEGKQENWLFVVSCPKDLIMFSDAVKTTANDGAIQVIDLIQLVEQATGLDKA